MNSKKFNLFVLASFSLGLIALILPAASMAQGRYTGRYSKRDVSGIITKLEQTSNEFRRNFDRQLDNSSMNGTNEEERMKRIVSDYENSLDRLRSNYDSYDTWWQSRNNVQDVMREARNVNVMMNSLPFARRLENQWKNMRRDLNKLADTYDLPLLDGSGGGGGGGGNIPNWAIGTFTARNPQNGGTITLTINSNGNVTVNFDGRISNATMNGTRLYNDGVEGIVTRTQNGIRTTNAATGEAIDYYRNSGGNNNARVPSWAIGTFSARNPQNGGTITLTINSNGNVVVNFDGVISYATMNGDRLYNNGVEGKVTKTRNGIRTTNLATGEAIDYTRQNY